MPQIIADPDWLWLWCRLVTPQEEEDSFQSFRAAVAADREQGRRPLFCLANVHSTLFQRQNVTALQVGKTRNQCSGSGSTGSTCFFGASWIRIHQAKLIRKTLIPTVLWLLLDFFSLKNYVNVPLKSNMQKNIFLLVFCWRLEGQWRK